MKKKIPPFVFPIAVLILAASFIIFLTKRPANPSDSQNIFVSTSFYPLYFFTKHITCDRAYVVNITPAWDEPHDYEPSTADIATLETSHLTVLNRAHLES